MVTSLLNMYASSLTEYHLCLDTLYLHHWYTGASWHGWHGSNTSMLAVNDIVKGWAYLDTGAEFFSTSLSRMNVIVPFLALANGGRYEQDGMGGDNSPHLLKVSNEFTKKTYRIDTFACARCFNF